MQLVANLVRNEIFTRIRSFTADDFCIDCSIGYRYMYVDSFNKACF